MGWVCLLRCFQGWAGELKVRTLVVGSHSLSFSGLSGQFSQFVGQETPPLPLQGSFGAVIFSALLTILHERGLQNRACRPVRHRHGRDVTTIYILPPPPALESGCLCTLLLSLSPASVQKEGPAFDICVLCRPTGQHDRIGGLLRIIRPRQPPLTFFLLLSSFAAHC